MKYILTLLIISITLTATAQRNIYSPIYPVSVAYINKVGLDSNFNFFLSQSFLDSLKFSYDSIKNHRTVINTLNLNVASISVTTNSLGVSLQSTNATVANHGLTLNTHTNQIAGQSNQISATQVNVAQNTADINNNKKTTDSIVANWPTGGGGIVIIPSRTMSVSGSISQSDLARDIYTNFSGTVTVPQMPDGWYCWVWRKSGTPTFKTPSGIILGTISVKGGLVKIASNGTTMNVSVR